MDKYKHVYRTGFEKRHRLRWATITLQKKYADNPVALAMIERRRNFTVDYS